MFQIEALIKSFMDLDFGWLKPSLGLRGRDKK